MKSFCTTVWCLLHAVLISISISNCELRENPNHHTRPHIIIIIADDLGWNDVSFHGSNQIPTPNIDALAANGIILNRYYVQPTCTPSRTAYLTGRYPLRSGMQGEPLKVRQRWGIPLGVPLLPEHLRNLGYTTRLVGKWHVGYYTVEHTPTHRGFDSFLGYYNGYINYFNHTIKNLYGVPNITGYDIHRDTQQSSDVEWDREYFTDVITHEVENIISGHDTSKPLYLQVAHLAPHAGGAEEPVEVWNLTEVNESFGYIEDVRRRKYAGMVSRLDQSVGRTIKALKGAGMLENSIVIFTTDNGAQTEGLHENYGSNYPLRGLKWALFDGAVRGAACVYSPLLNNISRVSHELMHITDWMPTLYSAAGGNLDDLGEIDGVNQWPALKDGVKSPRDSIILDIDELEGVAGVISGNYKLLKGHQKESPHFYGDDGVGDDYPSYNATSAVTSDAGEAIAEISRGPATLETIVALRNESSILCPPHDDYANCTDTCLFDLTEDPCETVDVSAQHPEIVQSMENLLTPFREVLLPQSTLFYDFSWSLENFDGVWKPWVKLIRNNRTGAVEEVVISPIAVDEMASSVEGGTIAESR